MKVIKSKVEPFDIQLARVQYLKACYPYIELSYIVRFVIYYLNSDVSEKQLTIAYYNNNSRKRVLYNKYPHIQTPTLNVFRSINKLPGPNDLVEQNLNIWQRLWRKLTK